MNYTTHFHLPQWDKDDRIMMDDFNQMASNLENALSLSQDATQKAQQAAQAAQSAANGAQTAANGAQSAADAAQETADEALRIGKAHVRLINSSYLGSGGTQTITLRDVTFVWLVAISGRPHNNYTEPVVPSPTPLLHTGIIVLGGGGAYGETMESGFKVNEGTGGNCPNMNQSGYRYNYTAICT